MRDQPSTHPRAAVVGVCLLATVCLLVAASSLTRTTSAAFTDTTETTAGFVADIPPTPTLAWGNGSRGQLGDGTTTNTQATPTPVAGAHTFHMAAAGDQYTCAIDAAGAAWCWGAGFNGRLGDGTVDVQRSTPVAVSGGHIFAAIGAGQNHTCAIDTTGAAWCWGAASNGQLGIGVETADQSVPTAVLGGHTFTDISVGVEFSCGLDTDGAAWCWGEGSSGRLGNGGTTDQRTPSPVHGTHVFTAISAGLAHACAIDTVGSAWCWGYSSNGPLGNGSVTGFHSTPVAVLGGHTFTDITAGYFHTCAIDTAGAMWCWGDGLRGQRGDGTTTRPQGTPVAVLGNITASRIAAGSNHTCAIDTTAAAWCWGWNSQGQLGDGMTQDQTSPVAVVGGHVFSDVSGGSSHTIAVP
ncbi:BNR repeat domain protein (plasmid) [Euzebya pacifica]|uniref:BNR repeat domain protein n=1 Tax=Euzebya pacifica TaxID=1608957 RepID=A0A346Y6J9_9ACTN|nr:hypothetical protein [Euzebya pacifica]AXV10096.1 BNR repeat domain protein [Euzebya pacifica]